MRSRVEGERAAERDRSRAERVHVIRAHARARGDRQPAGIHRSRVLGALEGHRARKHRDRRAARGAGRLVRDEVRDRSAVAEIHREGRVRVVALEDDAAHVHRALDVDLVGRRRAGEREFRVVVVVEGNAFGLPVARRLRPAGVAPVSRPSRSALPDLRPVGDDLERVRRIVPDEVVVAPLDVLRVAEMHIARRRVLFVGIIQGVTARLIKHFNGTARFHNDEFRTQRRIVHIKRVLVERLPKGSAINCKDRESRGINCRRGAFQNHSSEQFLRLLANVVFGIVITTVAKNQSTLNGHVADFEIITRSDLEASLDFGIHQRGHRLPPVGSKSADNKLTFERRAIFQNERGVRIVYAKKSSPFQNAVFSGNGDFLRNPPVRVNRSQCTFCHRDVANRSKFFNSVPTFDYERSRAGLHDVADELADRRRRAFAFDVHGRGKARAGGGGGGVVVVFGVNREERAVEGHVRAAFEIDFRADADRAARARDRRRAREGDLVGDDFAVNRHHHVSAVRIHVESGRVARSDGGHGFRHVQRLRFERAARLDGVRVRAHADREDAARRRKVQRFFDEKFAARADFQIAGEREIRRAERRVQLERVVHDAAFRADRELVRRPRRGGSGEGLDERAAVEDEFLDVLAVRRSEFAFRERQREAFDGNTLTEIHSARARLRERRFAGKRARAEVKGFCRSRIKLRAFAEHDGNARLVALESAGSAEFAVERQRAVFLEREARSRAGETQRGARGDRRVADFDVVRERRRSRGDDERAVARDAARERRRGRDFEGRAVGDLHRAVAHRRGGELQRAFPDVRRAGINGASRRGAGKRQRSRALLHDAGGDGRVDFVAHALGNRQRRALADRDVHVRRELHEHVDRSRRAVFDGNRRSRAELEAVRVGGAGGGGDLRPVAERKLNLVQRLHVVGPLKPTAAQRHRRAVDKRELHRVVRSVAQRVARGKIQLGSGAGNGNVPRENTGRTRRKRAGGNFQHAFGDEDFASEPRRRRQRERALAALDVVADERRSRAGSLPFGAGSFGNDEIDERCSVA